MATRARRKRKWHQEGNVIGAHQPFLAALVARDSTRVRSVKILWRKLPVAN